MLVEAMIACLRTVRRAIFTREIMKKRYLVAGVTAVLVAGVGLTSLMTGKSPMLLVRQQVAKAVVKANDADLSPPAEFQASTSEKRDKRAKEELGYVVGTQAYLYGAASERYQSFRYGIGQLAKLSKRFNPDRFSANSHDGVQYNELNFVRKLPDPDLKLGITPNVDTLYGSIFFNLHDEPVVLTIPQNRRPLQQCTTGRSQPVQHRIYRRAPHGLARRDIPVFRPGLGRRGATGRSPFPDADL